MTQLVMFMVGLSLYSSHRAHPAVSAGDHGLLRAPGRHGRLFSGGLVLMFLFPVAGALAPKFDPRKLVAIGFVITTFGLWRMTEINLNISFGMAVSWRAVIALGLPFLFIPINTLCYAGIPQEKYNEVSGLTALMRNLGGSVGISFVTTLLARLSQKHLAMLVPDRPHRAIRRMTRCVPASPAHGCSAARAMPDAMHHAGAQIYGMAQIQAPPARLCRCHLGDGRRNRSPDPAALRDEPPPKTPRRPHRPLKRSTASYSKPPAPHSIRHPERPTGVEGPAAAFSSLTKQSWRFSTHSFPGTIPRAVACSPSMRVLCA